jgi:hypothetical protein
MLESQTPDAGEIVDNSSGEKQQIRPGVVPPSKQDREQLLRTLKGWWRHDGPHAKKWRDGDKSNIGAREAFDFVAMRQWTEGDIAYLEANRRAPITFNRVLPTVAAVTGIEINSRHDIAYLPVTSDLLSQGGRIKVKANEVLGQASRFFADEADAHDHQSESFRDSVIAGLGATETRVSYDDDPSGSYGETSLNPLEVAWDYRARGKNLADRQRCWHLKRMSLEEAQGMFPDADMEDLDARWALADVEVGKDRVDDDGRSREQEMEESERDPQTEVFVLRCQWWEFEQIMIVARPDKPAAPVYMTMEEFEKFQADYMAKAAAVSAQMAQQALAQGLPPPPAMQPAPLKATPGRRKVYRETYIGRVILADPAPPQYREGFTINFITGIPDKNRGHWFGLVAVMRDPQRWANSWLSQTQHILNSTAKGGIIAEEDAFDNPNKAAETYARPDAITFVSPGAISKGKIMQKPGVGISAGHANLMEFAISSIRDVTGINLELLGLRDANQPGILEAQRKQAAMTILAPWFDALQAFRKSIGRVRLFYIQEYLASPDRLIRIAGDEGYELVPLLAQDVIGKHDVVVSDAPNAPNQKEATWAAIKELLPLFRDALMASPDALMIILDHSPIPASLVGKLREIVSKPNPGAEEQKAIAKATAEAELGLTKAKTEQAYGSAAKANADAILQIAAAFQQSQDARMAQFGDEIEIFANSMRDGKRSPLVNPDEDLEAIYAQPSAMQLPRLMGPPQVPNQAPEVPEIPPELMAQISGGAVPTQGPM